MGNGFSANRNDDAAGIDLLPVLQLYRFRLPIFVMDIGSRTVCLDFHFQFFQL